MIAAIDVDATVVDSPYMWYQWLEQMTKAGYRYEEVSKQYNFSKVYEKAWEESNISGHPLDFWRMKHVYQDMTPIDGSVEALSMLKSIGYKIVFVSALKGDHHYSKYRFLEQYFPFMDGFVGTKEKWAVNADLVVDDRHKFLNMFPSTSVLKFKFETPFDQDEDLKVSALSIGGWCELEKMVRRTL